MKFSWIAIVVAGLVAVSGVIAADPAFARTKHKAKPHCVDRPYQFSWSFLIPGSPTPQPNGCSPPVYQYGRFIGQDPDRNIRFQLKRDPDTGYAPL